MPIGSPDFNKPTDFGKHKTSSSPSNFNVVGSQHVIRPELVRPSLAPPQALPPGGNTTSVIRISPASSATHQILRPVIVDPTRLIPVLPNSEVSLTKNGISTGSVYQWHSLLPVIKTSSNANKNVTMASPVVHLSPMKMQTIKNGVDKFVEPNEAAPAHELYENDDDAGDDDVFEAEPVKANHTKDNSMIKHPSISHIQQESYYDNKREDNPDIKDDINNSSAESDITSAYNKRRTQSCSALQANQNSGVKVKIKILID